MAKTPLDEKWRYCARCGYRQPESKLWKDPDSGFEYCTQQVYCKDEPGVNEMRRKYHIKGRIFDR